MRRDEAKEGTGRHQPRQCPAMSTPMTMQATETATEAHATLIPSLVDANHVRVDGEDDVSHIDAQPCQRRDLSFPPFIVAVM